MNWLSDKKRFIIFLSILLVFGSLLTSLISYEVSKRRLMEITATSELPLTSDNIFSEIQRDLLLPIFISSVMAQDTFLRDWAISGEIEEDKVRKYLKEIKSKYNTITSFFVSEKTKHYYNSDGLSEVVSKDNPYNKWYFRVRDMAPDYEVNVDPDMLNKEALTIFVNHKVFDYSKNYIGATGVGLSVNAVRTLIDEYATKYQRNIYFTDTSGNIIMAGSSPNARLKNIDEIAGLTRFRSQIYSKASGNFTYQRDGDQILLATRFIPELNWTLFVEQSESELLSGLRWTLFMNLLISMAITTAVLIATFYAHSRYQSQLEKMAKEEKASNDQLTQLNNQKDKMLSIISHDLRSPFTAILGFAELLVKKAPTMTTEKIVEHTENLFRASTNANGLLDSLLGWASIQWGNLAPAPQTLNISKLLRHNVNLFTPVAEKKDVSLHISDIANIDVIADPYMTDMIIRNLVNNAIKFSNHGGMITLSVTKHKNDAWISISDTGVGITAEKISKLFTPNDHLSTYGTDGEAGIGMGLILCQEMVEANGGEIRVESKQDEGAKFSFSLPLADTSNT